MQATNCDAHNRQQLHCSYIAASRQAASGRSSLTQQPLRYAPECLHARGTGSTRLLSRRARKPAL